MKTDFQEQSNLKIRVSQSLANYIVETVCAAQFEPVSKCSWSARNKTLTSVTSYISK